MSQENTVLGLMSQTSIHAGTGQNTGIIDLPIQREGHNGWPCVFGSAVKGALRSRAEQDNMDKETIESIFGPDTECAGDFASAIMVSDARIVLFPVRSLTSQFKWVTCPAVLERLNNDIQRFGFPGVELESFGIINKDQALSVNNDSDSIFLEEYRFSVNSQKMDNVISLLTKLIKRNGIKEALVAQLIILSNDSFTYMVQHATPVNAHIAIQSETKTVSNGALWYEETLPPETLLYIGLGATDARKSGCDKKAAGILSGVTGLFKEKPWLQIGGNETVGMGWCAISDYKEIE